MTKQRINLNDLPTYSVWPARLLGLAPWTTPHRTIEKIDEEYDKDKYARCLDYYIHAGEKTIYEDIKQFELGIDLASKVSISYGDELYNVCLSEAKAEYNRLLLDTVNAEVKKCKTIVELGCGYGYNLCVLKQQFPAKTFLGGEYSENAVELASRLYKYEHNIRVLYFNFYDEKSYTFLQRLTPPIVVFTAHAIEQLQSASPILDALLRYREILQAVFHLEPVPQLQNETLLGLMRRRYAAINDYNRDLLSELQKRSYIRILDIQTNVIGLNPLNPTSVIQWEFSRI